MNLVNRSSIIPATIIGLLAFLLPVYAEGPIVTAVAEHPEGGGVDRRVRTLQGYKGAKLTATLDAHLPKLANNIYGDNHSVYLGGGQANNGEVDAGVGYDQKLYTFNYSDNVTAYNVHPGYYAFISHDTVFTNLKFWDQAHNSYIPWRDLSGTYAIQFEVLDTGAHAGAVSLTVNGSQFYWTTSPFPNDPYPANNNPNGENIWPAEDLSTVVFDAANGNLSTLYLKRLVAMNRFGQVYSQPQYDDDSYMYGNVNNCMLMRYNSNVWTNWSGTDVDQPNTGFDSPGNGLLGAKDLLQANKEPTPSYLFSEVIGTRTVYGSQYRVNFPYLTAPTNIADARTNSNTSLAATSGLGPTPPSRYSSEYVEIWLRHGKNHTVPPPVLHPPQHPAGQH